MTADTDHARALEVLRSCRLDSYIVPAVFNRLLDVYAAAVPALEILRQDIRDIGGCEHDVGHCICALVRQTEELSEALANVAKAVSRG